MNKKNVYLATAIVLLVSFVGIIYKFNYGVGKNILSRQSVANQAAESPAGAAADSSQKISDEEEVVGPKIEITPAFYNLGTVVYGQVAKYNFTATNRGSAPLEIIRLSTSCGCTKAFIAEDKKIIQPQQSAEILVTFDPATHKDDTDLGEITRIVYVKSNDPLRPEVEIELRAKVIKK